MNLLTKAKRLALTLLFLSSVVSKETYNKVAGIIEEDPHLSSHQKLPSYEVSVKACHKVDVHQVAQACEQAPLPHKPASTIWQVISAIESVIVSLKQLIVGLKQLNKTEKLPSKGVDSEPRLGGHKPRM